MTTISLRPWRGAWIALTVSLVAGVWWWGGWVRDNSWLELDGRTMGTGYTVRAQLPGITSGDLSAAVEDELTGVNGIMSTYDPQSELSRFNRRQITAWVAVSPALARVVSAGQVISVASGGAFDMTVGPLVSLWGFGPGPVPVQPPSDQDLAGVLAQVGAHRLDVRIDPPGLRKQIPDLSLDLSAIAKGYAVDRIAEMLDRLGAEAYLVDIGGEIRVRGTNPRSRPWRIGIEQPRGGPPQAAIELALKNVAVATSGNYRNVLEFDGRRLGHVIDPRTGWPVEHDLMSVTVVAAECMLADAWATALLVAGPGHARELAERQQLAVIFQLRDGDGIRLEFTGPAGRFLQS